MITQPKIVHLSPSRAQLFARYTLAVWPVRVTIEDGFTYDGASIPVLAQPLVGGPWARSRLPAATVHDWLYASHAVPRWIADLVFLFILLRTGLLTPWRCVVDWWAVRRFGRPAWRSHGPEEQARARALGSIRFF